MTRRNSTIIAMIAVIAVALISVPMVIRVWELTAYAKQQRIGEELIRSLRDRRPDSVSIQQWEKASDWANVAYINVCFSEEHVSFEQLVRFNQDAQIELQGNVNLQTINWIWSRLAKTGPHGQRYFERFEPQYMSFVYEDSLNDTSE